MVTNETVQLILIFPPKYLQPKLLRLRIPVASKKAHIWSCTDIACSHNFRFNNNLRIIDRLRTIDGSVRRKSGRQQAGAQTPYRPNCTFGLKTSDSQSQSETATEMSPVKSSYVCSAGTLNLINGTARIKAI